MIENGEVRKHRPIVVAENLSLTVILLGLLLFSLPLLRDVIYDKWGIYGGLLFKTPSNFSDLHIIFGFLLVIIGLIHVAVHFNDKKSGLLMKRPIKDFKGFLHSLFYLIGFAKREEQGGGDRYTGRQRVVYLGLVYTIGLSAISGVSLYIIPAENELTGIFSLTHVLSAILIILVLLFHLAINIRRHDSVALKCSFATGKLPLWHIKKHHKIWYLRIQKHEEKLVKKMTTRSKRKTSDAVAKAMIKMYAMDGIDLPAEAAEKLTKEFKQENKPKDIARFIEISKIT